MNIIGTINFFFRKFLKEAGKKHQSILQIEKAAKVFAVQKKFSQTFDVEIFKQTAVDCLSTTIG